MKYNLSLLLLALFLVVGTYSCKKGGQEVVAPGPGNSGGGNESSGDTNGETDFKLPPKEIRSAWMATVYEIDWPQGEHSQEAQKQKYIHYLEEFKKLHINAIFFQIKSMGDAFYDSPYEPWSKSITGTRGQDPGYDVMKFLITEAHARGIEFHAWMNPFRIGTRSGPGDPFPALPSTIPGEWVVDLSKVQIYNPAIPEVRERLADIVADVINKYDVDGIHFDDYFYPEGETLHDQADYAEYGSDYSSIEDFRRANVNKAIQGVHDRIVQERPEVVFSVSPAPDQDKNFTSLFADVKKWCEEGWLDIVIPQLYQEIGNPYNDFQTNLNWWSHFKGKAELVIGYGLYKFGDPQMGSAFQSSGELSRQMDLVRKDKFALGDVFYSAQHLLLNKVGVTDRIKDYYKNPAVMPFFGREVADAPGVPSNLKIQSNRLTWEAPGNNRSVVYYFSSPDKEGVVVDIVEAGTNEIEAGKVGSYVVTSLNADNVESKPSEAVERK